MIRKEISPHSRSEACCDENHDAPLEIAFVGDITDNEQELTEKILDVPYGGQCTFFIDSPGGSPYCAISLMNLLLMRRIQGTAIVTGECSSAALWPFAACTRRIVTPYSVLLFHPMKWQSEEHVGLAEAREWARHFGELETEMDHLLARLLGIEWDELRKWMTPGRYLSGRDLVEAGLAEMMEVGPLQPQPLVNGRHKQNGKHEPDRKPVLVEG